MIYWPVHTRLYNTKNDLKSGVFEKADFLYFLSMCGCSCNLRKTTSGQFMQCDTFLKFMFSLENVLNPIVKIKFLIPLACDKPQLV